ncbi:MAG: hypothetical protein KGJ86_12550 [Chloroflexota bacterium]|nr:hypothetical protein [Chloroflexota bacterium]
MAAKQATEQRTALAAGGLAAAAGVLGGLGATGIATAGDSAALAVTLLAPKGPISRDLESIYADANWRAQRDSAIAAAVRHDARVVKFANQDDCLYYVAICARDVGKDDSDDRWTVHLSASGVFARDYSLGVRHYFWSIPASHEDILSSGSPAISASLRQL